MLDMVQTRPAADETDTLRRLMRRRTRYTRSEAVALNYLVNADGQPVTVGELARECDMMESSIIQLIYRLRTKLGEAANAPQLITSASWWDERGIFWKAWRFNEPE